MSPVLRKYSSWIVPFLIAGGSMVAAYFHNDKVLAERVTVVETQQKNDDASIHRVEAKVDKVYDKLIEWERAK